MDSANKKHSAVDDFNYVEQGGDGRFSQENKCENEGAAPVTPEVNFVLHPATHDADMPEWPHFKCGDGYAWHPDSTKRKCFQGNTSAPAELVAKIFLGLPIERLLAMRELLRDHLGAFPRLFTARCSACGYNHQRGDGLRWARVAKKIHEGAIAALREANPAQRRILDIRNLKTKEDTLVSLPEGMGELPEKKTKEGKKRKPNDLMGLPVCDTPTLTLQAQLGFAEGLKLLKEKPIVRDYPKRPPPMFRLPGRPRKDGHPPGWRPPEDNKH